VGGVAQTEKNVELGKVTKTHDSLTMTVDEITTWLERNGLQTFWGAIESSGDETHFLWATWTSEASSDWKAFLTLAKDCNAKVVFIDRTILRLDEFAKDQELPLSSEVQRLVDRLRPHDGQIRYVELQWLWGPVVMRFTKSADWNTDLEKLERSALIVDGGDDEEYDTGESLLSDSEVQRYAVGLASDPSFQVAKSTAQRRYVARKILPSEHALPEEDVGRVVDRAKVIYEVEIKPKQQADLAERVEKLREGGSTRAQIARQLGLSSERVKDLGG